MEPGSFTDSFTDIPQEPDVKKPASLEFEKRGPMLGAEAPRVKLLA